MIRNTIVFVSSLGCLLQTFLWPWVVCTVAVTISNVHVNDTLDGEVVAVINYNGLIDGIIEYVQPFVVHGLQIIGEFLDAELIFVYELIDNQVYLNIDCIILIIQLSICLDSLQQLLLVFLMKCAVHIPAMQH